MSQTEPLETPATERIVDALPLLDHRTASRTIPVELAPRGAYLLLQDGEQQRLLALDGKVTHVGRGLGAEVRIEEQRVSRSHAIVVRHGRFTRVLDNRSANGTFVNGRRIVATNLDDGDVLCFGPVAVQYVEVR